MPARIFSSVDLPVPFPPTRPVRSLGVMSQLTSSKRSFGPNRLPAADSCNIQEPFSHLLQGLDVTHRAFSASKRKWGHVWRTAAKENMLCPRTIGHAGTRDGGDGPGSRWW